MKTTRVILMLSISCLSGCGVGQQQRATQLAYAPDTVEIRGILWLEEHFGPPGYGEDTLRDLRLRVPVLTLSTPVDVVGDSANPLAGDTYRGVERIQLTALPAGTNLPQLVSRTIVVRGVLQEAVWGRQYTQVVIEVASISPP